MHSESRLLNFRDVGYVGLTLESFTMAILVLFNVHIYNHLYLIVTHRISYFSVDVHLQNGINQCSNVPGTRLYMLREKPENFDSLC